LNTAINEEEKAQVLSGKRRLWCTSVFIAVADRVIVERAGDFIPVLKDQKTSEERTAEPFRFVPVSLYVDEDAKVIYEESPRAHVVQRFEIASPDQYSRIMTSVTRYLISSVPIKND